LTDRDFWNEMYNNNSIYPSKWPSPLGLSLGLLTVVIGQIFMLLYFIYIALPIGRENDRLNKNKNDVVGLEGNKKPLTVSSSVVASLSPSSSSSSSPPSSSSLSALSSLSSSSSEKEQEHGQKEVKQEKEDTGVKKLYSFQSIQKVGARPYELWEGLVTHLAQPEGFVMLGGYLIGTWMFGLMPSSYYNFTGGINWFDVFMQLILQDLVQYLMHVIEHVIKSQTIIRLKYKCDSDYESSSEKTNNSSTKQFGIKFQWPNVIIQWPFNLYAVSHKPHHRFTNPRLFDAFNGSPTDTFLMILVPLIITARLVNANVWSYMAFGSLYANWLTMIHAEYSHPWDPLFRKLGLGTAADHHVHHKLFNFNYGHLFMYWDRILGTYKDPASVSWFNENI
jgi:sterol desaturase/sphingolipid hydroxylase (fatty acid hydroxylase superfamily)